MKPPAPLKGKRFEQKPKKVIKADDFQDHCGVMRDARLVTEFHEILDCIHNGWPIPDRCYQRQIDQQGDRLLSELGVKHLHLGGQGSDIIVYLAEFGSFVELLEINGHVHLETEPRGRDLRGRFRAHAGTAGAVAGAVVAGAVVGAALAKASRGDKPKSRNKGGRGSDPK